MPIIIFSRKMRDWVDRLVAVGFTGSETIVTSTGFKTVFEWFITQTCAVFLSYF